jgi:signal transduction histidine kinase
MGIAYSGGLGSPYAVLLAWPTLTALLLFNQAFVFLSIVGSLVATGLVVALHYGFSVAPLLGPHLLPDKTNLYQAPFFLVLLVLMGLVGRRGALQEQKYLRTVSEMQKRLAKAHDELTQSFHDLEASMDRGRTNERLAKETRDQLMRAERFSTTGKLAAGTLHDLSNPLSVIVSEAEMLLLNYEERAPKTRKSSSAFWATRCICRCSSSICGC